MRKAFFSCIAYGYGMASQDVFFLRKKFIRFFFSFVIHIFFFFFALLPVTKGKKGGKVSKAVMEWMIKKTGI